MSRNESQTKFYVILLAICVAIITLIAALSKGRDLAINVLLTGIGVLIGFAIAAIFRKKTDSDKIKS